MSRKINIEYKFNFGATTRKVQKIFNYGTTTRYYVQAILNYSATTRYVEKRFHSVLNLLLKVKHYL